MEEDCTSKVRLASEMLLVSITLNLNGSYTESGTVLLNQKSHKSHYFYGFTILFYILNLRPSFKLNKLF